MPTKMRVRKVVKVDAAGGVVYRRSGGDAEILLIFRRGVWDLPKGKKEDNETFEECALREVAEEVGAEQLVLEDHLVNTYHEYEENGLNYGKTTKWYPMRWVAENNRLEPQQEEGIEALQWVPVREAVQQVGFQNLVTVIKAFTGRGGQE